MSRSCPLFMTFPSSGRSFSAAAADNADRLEHGLEVSVLFEGG